MKLGFGFGAERLGLLTLAHPWTALIGVLLLSGLLAFHLPGLRFEGDVLRLMDHNTRGWADFQTVSEDFPAAMPDIYVLAKSETVPPTMDWLGQVQDLQLDLQLLPAVVSVQSVFSLRAPDGAGSTRPLVNPFDPEAAPVDLGKLAAENPLVRLFLRPDLGFTVLAISLDNARDAETAELAAGLAGITDLVAQSGLQTEISGRSTAQVELSGVIQSDLIHMVILSLIVGWIVGFAIFNDIRATAITNLVAPVAMGWTAGFYAMLGIPLDSASVILPLLAAIIAFADAVHLVVPFQRRLLEGEPLRKALHAMLVRVGPATALTSMTTAVAFGSLALAGGGLSNMAIMGLAAVLLAWLTVMTVCPLLCLVLARKGLGETRLAPVLNRQGGWRLARGAIRHRYLLTVAAVLLAGALVLAESGFRSTHQNSVYFPDDSSLLQADRTLSDAFAGSSTILVRMPLPVPGDATHPDNRARLETWHHAIADATGGNAVWSRASLDPELAALMPADSGDLSPGLTHALIAVRHPWDATDAEIVDLGNRIRAAVTPLPGGDEAVISGVTMMITLGSKANIDRLRGGMFLSVLLAAGLVALASRSLSAGAGTGLAVLLSVLLVLCAGAMPLGRVDYGLVVALIISVGIAIDDGVHLVNNARHSDHFASDRPRAYRSAVARAGTAIVLSSVILIAALLVTQVADMPAIRNIGREIVLALTVALGLTLTVAPAATLTAHDLLSWLRQGRKTRDPEP